jgi:phage shock protein PspC (stress-responsive transcriptional regulator)
MDKKLYRSKKDSMIAGVAGGLAEYFAIDPVLIRLLFVLSVFLQGMGLLAYIILWIVVPQKKEEPAAETANTAPESGPEIPRSPDPEAEEKKRKRTSIGAYILIALGAFFLADNLMPNFDLADYWPVALIAVGIGLLYNATRKKNGNGASI